MRKFHVVVFNQSGVVESNQKVIRSANHPDGPFTFWVVEGGTYHASFNSNNMAELAISSFLKNKKVYRNKKFVPVYLKRLAGTTSTVGLLNDATDVIVLSHLADDFMNKYNEFAPGAISDSPDEFQKAFDAINKATSQPEIKAESEELKKASSKNTLKNEKYNS